MVAKFYDYPSNLKPDIHKSWYSFRNEEQFRSDRNFLCQH